MRLMNSSLNSKTNMEYTLQEYKRREGKVFTTSDGHKYTRSKITEKYIYLKCALFRQSGCKGTSRLNRETDLITPLTQHHHSNEDYQSNIFDLKTKCKILAKHTQTNLRKVFDDATRTDPSAHDISFAECEAAMYRARKTLQPKIPQSAYEFSEMLSSTHLGIYNKFNVTCGGQTGVIFFSDLMKTFMAEVTNIQFDWTFYTVPNQFYQLWTIFVSVGRNTLPAIHCLLTSRKQELYQAVLESLKEISLYLDPSHPCPIGNMQQGMRLEKFIRKLGSSDVGSIIPSEFGAKNKSLGLFKSLSTNHKSKFLSEI